MTKKRLSDYVRASTSGRGIRLAQRAGTSRHDHFGDEGVVTIDKDEARELRAFLDDVLDGDGDD